MGILVAYLWWWWLQLSIDKTVLAAFHLNNRVKWSQAGHSSEQQALGIPRCPSVSCFRLYKIFSFRQCQLSLNAKVASRVVLICHFAGLTWGTSAKTLRISTKALVFSIAEYCISIWCRSLHASTVQCAPSRGASASSLLHCLCFRFLQELPLRALRTSGHPCTGQKSNG